MDGKIIYSMKKITVIIFLVVLLSAATAGNFCYQIFWSHPAKDVSVKLFTVEESEYPASISRRLQEQGLIKNAWLFRWYLSQSGLDKKIIPGIWELRPGLSFRSLAQMFTDIQSASIQLTFIEGWDLNRYSLLLDTKSDFLRAGDWFFYTGSSSKEDFSQQFYFLKDKPPLAGLEGYLFPDTYRLHYYSSTEEIIILMLKNFETKLTPELRTEINRQEKTIFQIVTMASLAEAEAREEKDRRLVADILWRRLAIGMPLQLDSTVNYFLGTKKPAVSLKDRETDSPYNTYRYAGLPLGPINNPGLNAILAAIYPEKNDYWFFLTGTDGVMHYSKTLEEHNRNKVQYMKQ